MDKKDVPTLNNNIFLIFDSHPQKEIVMYVQ